MGCGSSKPPVAHAHTAPKSTTKPTTAPAKQSYAEQSQTSNPPEPQTRDEIETSPQNDGGILDAATLELSFEEAAALRVSDPSSMWAIVKKTCHRVGRNREWKVEPVKNRRGWKTIRLFVSSTFRDFHNEREVLVKEVKTLTMG